MLLNTFIVSFIPDDTISALLNEKTFPILSVPVPPIFNVPADVKLLNKLIELLTPVDAIVLALKIKFPHVLICPLVIEFPNTIVPVVHPFPS
jgi:hypothetical protein